MCSLPGFAEGGAQKRTTARGGEIGYPQGVPLQDTTDGGGAGSGHPRRASLQDRVGGGEPRGGRCSPGSGQCVNSWAGCVQFSPECVNQMAECVQFCRRCVHFGGAGVQFSAAGVGWGSGAEGRRDSLPSIGSSTGSGQARDRLRQAQGRLFDGLRAGSQRTLRTGDDGYTGGSIKGAAPMRAAGTVEVLSANSPSIEGGAHVQHLVHRRTRSGFRGN